jgi:hypothetical protein
VIALCKSGERFCECDSCLARANDVSESKCLVGGRNVDQSESRFFHASVKYKTLALEVSSFSAERLSTELISMRKSTGQPPAQKEDIPSGLTPATKLCSREANHPRQSRR